MDLDSQNIERRDFPISRRGYAPAAVDAHLRALAAAVEELRRAAAAPGPDRSKIGQQAASAGSQVQAIVAAAEVAAAEIESEAQANAEQTRAQAQADAEKTRADAIAQAQAHVAAVGRATATLLARVESLDGETGALVDSIRAGGTRLASDLAAVETNMGELYDAAAVRASAENGTAAGPDAGDGQEVVSAIATERPEPHVPPRPDDVPAPPVASTPTPASPTSSPPSASYPSPAASSLPAAPSPPAASSPPIPALSTTEAASQPAASTVQEPLELTPAPSSENGDAEGARLVALNMALNGDSREATDEYLAENYEIEDRQKLLDEVYAAIEG